MMEELIDKKRKTDKFLYRALERTVEHMLGVIVSIGAIGSFLYWLGATSFATSTEFQKFKAEIHEKADTMETAYIKKVANIDKTQAIQQEQIKNIKEDIRDIKDQNKEILYILRRRR